MGKIYLDTNVFFKNGFFRSKGAQAKLKACALAGYEVVLSEIVLDEVIGNFKKWLIQSKTALQKAVNSVNKIMSFEVNDIDVKGETDAFVSELELMIKELNIEILPYPSLTTKDLVIDGYKGMKPFDENGKGHKDYMIWTSIKNHMLTNTDGAPFLFISDNTGDFGVAKGKMDHNNSYDLHPHLLKEIETIKEDVSCYSDLQNALKHETLPLLHGLTLEDVNGKSAMLEHFVEQTIGEELPYTTMFGLEGVPFTNDVTIISYGHPENIETTFYKFENSYMARISGSAECLVQGYIDKGDYFADDLTDSVSISPCNDHVFEAEIEAAVEFEVVAIYDSETQSLSGQTFTITNEIEIDWYN